MSKKIKRRSAASPDRCTSEPVAKRTRAATAASKKQIQIPEVPVVQTEVASTDESTILDVLNEDCWRALLDYVSVPEIIRSERVSKQWQVVVHRYLRGVRLCILTSIYYAPSPVIPSVKCRILKVHSFYHMAFIQKYGPAIVAADCLHETGLRALGKYSPDLEDLRLHEAQYHSLKNRAVHFSKLRRLTLDKVIRFKDAHISKLLAFPTLKDLKIYDNQMMTGQCLNSLQANIRSLQLGSCRRLVINHMLTEVGGLVEAICALKRLRHLSFINNRSVRDEWLEAIGKSCEKLQAVDIGGCHGLTANGIIGLCVATSKTLTALGLSYNNCLADADVARCIDCCTKLEIIDLQCCRGISHEFPTCVSVPRPRALRVQLWSTMVYVARELYPTDIYRDLILDYSVIFSKSMFIRAGDIY